MSFESPHANEKLKWPEPGSRPEMATPVTYDAVDGSLAKQKNLWVVMGVVEQDGGTFVEIWHGHSRSEYTKRLVPLEELRLKQPPRL